MYRPTWTPENSSILSVSESIHGSICGTSDPLSNDVMRLYVAYLEWVINNWEVGHKNHEQYDTAVYNLVKIALKEGSDYLSQKENNKCA